MTHITGWRPHGQRIVIEAKDCAKTMLGPWSGEAEVERINDGALAGIIVHKRHGKGQPGQQWVTMTMDEFIAIVNGNREHLEKGQQDV